MEESIWCLAHPGSIHAIFHNEKLSRADVECRGCEIGTKNRNFMPAMESGCHFNEQSATILGGLVS